MITVWVTNIIAKYRNQFLASGVILPLLMLLRNSSKQKIIRRPTTKIRKFIKIGA